MTKERSTLLTRYRLWLALLLVAGVLSTSGSASAQTPTIIRVQPALGNYAPGQTFAAAVRIENVNALYGIDIHVAFDPHRLQVVESSVTPGTDLLSPPWLILFNQVDNEAGTIWYVATLLNPHEPVNGSGTLFSFHWRTVESGLTKVTIPEHTLSDINGELIEASTAGATYGAAKQVFLPLLLRAASRGGQAGISDSRAVPQTEWR